MQNWWKLQENPSNFAYLGKLQEIHVVSNEMSQFDQISTIVEHPSNDLLFEP